MPTKALIIDELGEEALLLPQRFEEAFAANNRIKFCLTLLQEAEHHANHPDEPSPDLSAERRAVGIQDDALDHAIADSRREADGSMLVPGAARLRRTMFDDIAKMRVPLDLMRSPEAESFAWRQGDLTAALPEFPEDHVPAGIIDAMTFGDRERGDSLHLLVMDMHKALNALQSDLAEETIDDARVWRIAEEDRPLVRAFMAGIHETAPLKFEHPGLATTATRFADQLVIQNDIGTTDAHVLVIHVTRAAVTLIYTDIHAARAEFFENLLKPFNVRWDDTRARHGEHLGEEPNYYLCTGRFEVAGDLTLERYLTFLGSRIVFLIDWNRARKRLAEFLPKGDNVKLLKWAADHNIGHRGFLKLGGERLIYEAIEFIQESPLRYGERLYDALGPAAALDFMKFVLRAATEGLLQGRSERFIRDEVKTELARHFLSAEANILSFAANHAALVFELATSLRDGLVAYRSRGDSEFLRRTAQRAHKWEQEADALVARTRSLVRRLRKPDIFVTLAHQADDAADGLEEAAFLATFLVKLPPIKALAEPVEALASLLVDGAQEQVKMFEAASHVRRDGAREDLQDFLEAVDRIVWIEHQTDEAERRVTGALLEGAPDFRTLHLLASIAHACEEAADAMLRTALGLRDHLLNDVMAG